MRVLMGFKESNTYEDGTYTPTRSLTYLPYLPIGKQSGVRVIDLNTGLFANYNKGYNYVSDYNRALNKIKLLLKSIGYMYGSPDIEYFDASTLFLDITDISNPDSTINTINTSNINEYEIRKYEIKLQRTQYPKDY